MGANEPVTEATCNARIGEVKAILASIRTDAREARVGVGALHQKLFEGNGDPFDVRIKQNTAFREHQQHEKEARERFKWTRILMTVIATVGWVIAIGICLVQMYL